MKHITVIGQMIECGIKDKKAYIPVLEEADKEIMKFTNDMNFVYEEPHNLFFQTTDERLSASVEKKENILKKPEIAIQESVKTKLAIFDDFIAKYHIGFIRTAEINDNGYAEVEIPCSIHSSFSSDDRASAKATFDAQIDFLKEIGLQLINTKNFGIRIMRTDNNFKILNDLLKEKGCTRVRFSVVDDTIDKIKFHIKAQDIENFKETPIDIQLETNEEFLNEDEIGKVFKYVKEILSAESSISFLGEKIKNTCCSLIQGYFSYICKVFGYEGEVVRAVNARHEEERNKNIEIRNIEKEIGNSVTIDQCKTVLTNCKEKIDKFTIENLSFRTSDFSIDKYGFVSFALHFTCCNWLNEYKLPTEEELKKNFQMSLGSQEDETLAMLDTYKNKQKIAKMLKDFCPTTRISEIVCNVRDGQFCINKINVVIDNIANII